MINMVRGGWSKAETVVDERGPDFRAAPVALSILPRQIITRTFAFPCKF